MAPTTFHLFPHLPAEIRFDIWDTAVHDRTEAAGVHYFSLLPAGGGTLETCTSVRLGPPACGDGSRCHHHGWHNGDDARSWRHRAGDSTCMLDSGLWTACHESRAAMRRAFPMDASPLGDGEYATALTADAHGVTKRCTFVPERDLFIFSLDEFIRAFEDPQRRIDCVFPSSPRRLSDSETSSSSSSDNTSATSAASSSLPNTTTAAATNGQQILRLRDLRHIGLQLDTYRLVVDHRGPSTGAGLSWSIAAAVAGRLPWDTSIFLFHDRLLRVGDEAEADNDPANRSRWGRSGSPVRAPAAAHDDDEDRFGCFRAPDGRFALTYPWWRQPRDIWMAPELRHGDESEYSARWMRADFFVCDLQHKCYAYARVIGGQTAMRRFMLLAWEADERGAERQ